MKIDSSIPSRPRVLIVEDEGVVAWDMERGLKDHYDVIGVARSGDEALAKAESSRPDVILMDVRIHGELDGIQTAQILRERHDIPIIYLTAHGDAETLERARRTEPYGYLLKPFKQSDLLSAVQVAIFRHGMELELRAREHLLVTTLRSIGEAVMMTDPQGRIIMANTASEGLTGWRKTEALGAMAEGVLRLSSERSGRPLPLPIEKAIRERATVQMEGVVVLARDGNERPISLSASPIADERKVYGAVMVMRDMTESRRLQKQLEFSDRLASLGTMAAGVAHEINNPLAFIVANVEHAISELSEHCEILEQGMASAHDAPNLRDVLTGLREAREGTDRVTRIVADLRTFSRDERTADRAIDLRNVLEWAINMTSHAWRQRALVTRDLGDVPLVRADEARLSQVFVNLMVNAAQAIEPGQPLKNQIAVTTRTGPDGWALVEVRDTGTGMSHDVAARIFEPFFTTKPIGSGTGLGLAICHGIITSFGGVIDVKSDIGAGTTFSLRLPPACANEQDEPSTRDLEPRAAPVSSKRAQRPSGPSVRRARVLVIDDDGLVRLAIQRTLQARHDVTLVGTVNEATAAIAETRFDAILCDLMMPEGNGVDFYLLAVAAHPDLAPRIAFLTGGALSDSMLDFLASVPNAKLQKPFDSAELHGLVESLIGPRS